MAITIDDFSKIWASTSPLTPYAFSEDNYKQGWNFVGATPPSRQMWDFLQKQNDEKMQYLADNYLPLSGGTLTGDLSVVDGTITGDLTGNVTGDVTGTASKAIADENGNNIASTYASIQYVDDKFAPIGTVVENTSSTEFSISAYGTIVLNQITLSKGTWLVIGGNVFRGTTQGYVYGINVDKVQAHFVYGIEGAVSQYAPANNYSISQESTIIVQINNSTEDVYLNGYSNHAVSGVTGGYLRAVRII